MSIKWTVTGETWNRSRKVTFQNKYCETETGIHWTCDERL